MTNRERYEAICSNLPEHQGRRSRQDAPLSGISVVDFTHFIAGPLATMMLADLGATVVKIEAPVRGDELRYYPPAHPSLEGMSAPFVWANRNKRSITLNLKSEVGREVAADLIAKSDVLVENFSTGVMERLGFGYAECEARNSRLVYCSLSAYGRDGRFADRRGFDPVVQAESGFISMNGYPDRDGTRTGSTIMDISAGMMACNAIMAGLMARERSSKGQRVEVSLFDTALTAIGYGTMQYLYTGENVGRWGNTSPDSSPTGIFHARDRAFYLSCTTTRLFHKIFTEVVNRPEIASDPRFQDPSGRIRHRDELVSVLEQLLKEADWEYWKERFRKAGVPVGEVCTLEEAVRSEVTQERQMVTKIRHRDAGCIPNVAMPFRFSDTPLTDPNPAPMLGEHTESVVREVLCYDEDRLASLTRKGAFGRSH